MELFDKKFVHFMWDDELEGKKCFLADGIDGLKATVEHNSSMFFEVAKGNDNYPFAAYQTNTVLSAYKFAYYDPNYETKKAFNEGKTIQYLHEDNTWHDCMGTPYWSDDCQYRVKPEEKWIAYIQCNNGKCRLVFCAEDRWGYVQDRFGVRIKLFVGSYTEVRAWCEARQKFTEVIKAWIDGKTIQLYNTIINAWVSVSNPIWDIDIEYRVEPECPCEKGIDSKACVGCAHSEAGISSYRPYKDSAEMIADFISRFKVKCPPYVEPLIWLKHKKCTDYHCLITTFILNAGVYMDRTLYNFEGLFNDYTYLDGSPCGVEVKE